MKGSLHERLKRPYQFRKKGPAEGEEDSVTQSVRSHAGAQALRRGVEPDRGAALNLACSSPCLGGRHSCHLPSAPLDPVLWGSEVLGRSA